MFSFDCKVARACYTHIILMEEIVLNKVNEYRVVAELTQEELALRVGVTRQTIVALEKGNYIPSLLLALKLAAEFSVSVETLFCIGNE